MTVAIEQKLDRLAEALATIVERVGYLATREELLRSLSDCRREHKLPVCSNALQKRLIQAFILFATAAAGALTTWAAAHG